MMLVEARKQVRRLRTYLGLGLVALIPVILTVSFKANPPRPDRERDFFSFVTHSGPNMAIVALTAESAFLLIVVASLFGGETVAGEASWGTLRYLLIRPVSRNRLLATKLGVAWALAVLATIAVCLVGLAVGTAAFGWHEVVTPAGLQFAPGAAVARLALATVYVAWGLSAFLAFGFMLSTMTDTASGAVAGGVGLGVVSQILNNISALNGISFAFPTHYLDAWHGLFVQPAQTADMVHGVLVQLPYVAVFLAVAFWWFNRKDVLS